MGKMKGKILTRILISSVLVCVSLSIGFIGGIKLKNNTPNTPTDGSGNDSNAQLQELVSLLENNWCSDIYYGPDYDSNLLINQFVGALSTYEETTLDPYTYLIKNVSSSAQTESGKMGITLKSYYNYPVVVDVDINGAAYGILNVGDIVVETGKYVDGKLVTYKITDGEYNFSNLFTTALGKPGDKIYIKVARFNGGKINYQIFQMDLKNASPVSYSKRINENFDDTIMVKLDNFTDSSTGNNTANDLDGILSKDNSKNIIIDLRDNGGGALSSAINVVDLFLPKDKLVTTLVYKDGTRDAYYTKTDDYYDYEKIIILQNGNTASASEIFISAMLYYFPEKVSLIGTESYGKGIAQLKRSVLNGEYILQYTCARWLRPNDEWIGMTDSYYGKDHENNYELGFDPSAFGKIDKPNILTLMQYYSSGIDFKMDSDFIAYKEDYVASSNYYFFKIFNEIYGTNGREDYYFDNNCVKLLKQYQEYKGVTNPDGRMNLDTYIHFVRDYYIQELQYESLFEERIKGFLI